MSYYVVKSFAVNNDKIQLEVADSSIYPRHYFHTEYMGKEDVSLEEKLATFFVSLQDGNFHAPAGSNIGRLAISARNIQNKLTEGLGHNLIDEDLKYGTNLDNEIKTYIAKAYMLPKILKKRVKADEIYEKSFTKKCIAIWKRCQQELAEKGVTLARAAIRVTYIKDMVLVLTYDGRLAFVKSENYTLGKIHHSEDAIFFGEESEWNEFAYPDAPSKEWYKENADKFPELKVLLPDFIEAEQM